MFIVNTSGKARLTKFYQKKDQNGADLVRAALRAAWRPRLLTFLAQTEHAQQQILTDVFQQVSRRAAHLCNFVEYAGCMEWGVGSRLVYKNFATL